MFAVNRLILLTLPTQNLSCSIDVQCYSLNLSLSSGRRNSVPNVYSVDSDLSGGLRHPTFEQLEAEQSEQAFH